MLLNTAVLLLLTLTSMAYVDHRPISFGTLPRLQTPSGLDFVVVLLTTTRSPLRYVSSPVISKSVPQQLKPSSVDHLRHG